MVKGLLQGISPPRPLFLPIVFSLGARVENLPLRAFLGNPTKISNSLRQIRTHLRADGVACYFDPFLEAEALGGALQWDAEGQRPAMRWPEHAQKGQLPEGLRSPEEAAKSGRVTVAVEVIRRLKSLLRDDPLLMAGVSGPLTLAARITQLDREAALRGEDLPAAALDLATSMIIQVSTAFAEAGANVIFIQEEILPALSAESCEAWASLLAPVFNVMRFYEALPVLHLANKRSFAENSEVIFQRQWDCVVCPAMDGISSLPSGKFPELRATALGVAMPLEAFQANASGGEDFDPLLHRVISELRPAILTTAGDVPAGTDLKRLMRVLEFAPRAV
jgi:hypothetical protein